MPNKANIPPEVQDFLRQYVTSVAQLEALLLLAAKPEVEWHTAEEISNELRSEQTLVAELLTNLNTAGVLAMKMTASDGKVRYRFAPQSSTLRHQVTMLETIYRELRFRVQAFIYASPT